MKILQSNKISIGIINIGNTVLFMVLFWLSVSAQASGQYKVIDSFVVYDNMNAKGKPSDLSKYGLKRIHILYPASNLTEPEEILEIKSWVNDAFGKTDHGLLSMDYESLSVDTRNSSESVVNDSINWYKRVLEYARKTQPQFKYGFYSILPLRDYWVPIYNIESDLQSWQKANDFLQPLADSVDVLYPSLYTFFNDQEGWVTYATENIKEARRLAKGKPIYAYLWPEYHVASPLAGQKIDGVFWRLQLETLKKLGIDGVVLWSNGQRAWNKNDAWWQATVEFLKDQNNSSSEFNQRPVVDATDHRYINELQVEFNMIVTDDGLPGPELSYHWYQSSGPDRVTFSHPDAQKTTVFFSEPGNYRLYFEADDGDLKSGRYLDVSIVSHQPLAKFSYNSSNNSSILDDQNRLKTIAMNADIVSGYKRQALRLNGENSYVQIENNKEFNFSKGNFSLATWVYVNEGDNENSGFISKGLVGACCDPEGYPGYFLGMRGNAFTFRIEDNAIGTNVRQIQAPINVPRNQWVHIASVKKNRSIELYIDGIKVAEETDFNYSEYNTDTEDDLVFGAQKYSVLTGHLNGKMDDTTLFNRALSANEIAELADKKEFSGGFHESPKPDSIQSGVGTLRGWVCNAGSVSFEVDNKNPVRVPYKGDRGDTDIACGDTDNGYSIAINWGNYTPGPHQLTVYAHDSQTRVISDTTFHTGRADSNKAFIKDLQFQYVVSGFPVAGKKSVIRWSEAAQNFIIIGVYNTDDTIGPVDDEPGAPFVQAFATALHESPATGSIQSGVGTLRGWVCDADNVTFQVDHYKPVRVPYKGDRGDTEIACGDADNGYSIAINWGSYEPGAHQLTVYAHHGDQAQIIGGGVFQTTRTGGAQQLFLKGLKAEYIVSGFPAAGKNAVIRWSEADQNFLVVAVFDSM